MGTRSLLPGSQVPANYYYSELSLFFLTSV